MTHRRARKPHRVLGTGRDTLRRARKLRRGNPIVDANEHIRCRSHVRHASRILHSRLDTGDTTTTTHAARTEQRSHARSASRVRRGGLVVDTTHKRQQTLRTSIHSPHNVRCSLVGLDEISKSRMRWWGLSQNNDTFKGQGVWFQKAQGKSKAAATKKKPAAAARPCGTPRKDRHWDGENGLVESGGVSHFVGARVPDVLDGGSEDGDDEPAPKKPKCIARSRRRRGCCCSRGCSRWRMTRRLRALAPVLGAQAAPTAPRCSARCVCRVRRDLRRDRAKIELQPVQRWRLQPFPACCCTRPPRPQPDLSAGIGSTSSSASRQRPTSSTWGGSATRAASASYSR